MTVTLRDILAVIDEPKLDGDPSVTVRGITHDSRNIEPGWVFVAMPGATTDGYTFVSDAVRAGAAAVIAERPRAEGIGNVAWVRVPAARKALGMAAAVVNGFPTNEMTLVGITGTNGKTTLTYLLEEIVRASGGTPGVIGTVSYRWRGTEQPAGNTTPEASEIQSIFRELVAAGVTHGMIEASSHGLHLNRLDGCQFDLGVFTNLSQDHLDYHQDLERYYQAKRLLFQRLLPLSSKPGVSAVVNLDDPYGRRLAREIENVRVIGFGNSPACPVRPEEVFLSSEGISTTIATVEGPLRIRSRLTGSFNLMNILAAVAVARSLGLASRAIQEGIEAVRVIPGRLERIPSERGSIFVDYAHTPQALKHVLEALRTIRTGRIITIMGCGGDRDTTKRPIMGKEAAAASDLVVVTSDNPRSEDPEAIIAQVLEGVREHGYRSCAVQSNGRPLDSGCYSVIADRREAIAWAIQNLRHEDILLVAGKGHESYQEIKGIRYPFDDRQVVREELRRNPAPYPESPSAAGPIQKAEDRECSRRNQQ
ncbi:MAG: UDP-N-acetylmuramoyl-L-alanyl-D-glutamate--2,6-diaminopimelate ligase [Deltaproteobacteria bacterium]